MSVLKHIRSDLIEMKAYTSTCDDIPHRLHANELPWAPLTLENLALNQYPSDQQKQRLRDIIADQFQVRGEELLLTRGSDDGIDVLMRLFLSARQDCFMQCPPTFPMYEFFGRLQQVDVINCPLDEENDFHLSVERLHSLWRPNCKLIFLCSPNNPTGTLIDLDIIKALCEYYRSKAVIIVDEAYIEYAETPSATTVLSSFDNLIVLRTLSKAYGLAGLRIGAIIAQPRLINAIQNTMPPYTLSSSVIDLALRALEDKAWFAHKIQDILKGRDVLTARFKQLPWIDKVYPSKGNFIFISSLKAQRLSSWFAELGIAVRSFDKMLRITVGNSSQNQQVLAALNSFRP